MWTIVEFTESRTVEAVPASWIFKNVCYWPTLSRDKLMNEIKNNASPNTNWPSYEIRTFKDGTYGNLPNNNFPMIIFFIISDNYLQARKKCKRAEETSDLNFDDNEHRRKIVKKKLSSSSSESDDDELTISPPPLLPSCSKS